MNGKAGLLIVRVQGEGSPQSPQRIARNQGPCWGSAQRPGILVYTIAGVRNNPSAWCLGLSHSYFPLRVSLSGRVTQNQCLNKPSALRS